MLRAALKCKSVLKSVRRRAAALPPRLAHCAFFVWVQKIEKRREREKEKRRREKEKSKRDKAKERGDRESDGRERDSDKSKAKDSSKDAADKRAFLIFEARLLALLVAHPNACLRSPVAARIDWRCCVCVRVVVPLRARVCVLCVCVCVCVFLLRQRRCLRRRRRPSRQARRLVS